MDSALTEAFWHVPHRIFGRKLKPLTLRHCFVLATAGNPLITWEGLATPSDLLQAVEICSRDSRFFLDGKRPSWFARQLTGAASLISKDGIPEFIAYLEDYMAGPSVWAAHGGKKAKAHWVISTVAGLAHWLHIPIETAWEMSPGAASWLLASAIEQSPHGSIDLMSEAEKAIVDEINAGRANHGN